MGVVVVVVIVVVAIVSVVVSVVVVVIVIVVFAVVVIVVGVVFGVVVVVVVVVVALDHVVLLQACTRRTSRGRRQVGACRTWLRCISGRLRVRLMSPPRNNHQVQLCLHS